jgi:preprotein translocase subunit YajC
VGEVTLNTLFALQLLLADGTAPDPNAAPQGNLLFSLLPMVVIFLLFYIFMVRAPMKRQEQERQNLLASLKKDDKVVTSGGIIGIIASVKDNEDEAVLKVDESSNVRLRVLKSSIQRVVTKSDAAKEQK